MTGVFDPPPSAIAVPWSYLGLVTALTLLALAVGAATATRSALRSTPSVLREL